MGPEQWFEEKTELAEREGFPPNPTYSSRGHFNYTVKEGGLKYVQRSNSKI